MARLAFIFKVSRVETYVWVVAVDVIKPDDVVHDLPWLLTAHLTQPTVLGYPVVYIGLPCFPPRWSFIELFLVQSYHSNRKGPVPFGPDPYDIIILI